MPKTNAKKTVKNHRQVNVVSRTNRLPFIFAIGLILLFISLIVNIKTLRPSASEMLGGASSAFHGRHIKDILLPPNESEARVLHAGTTPFAVNFPVGTENIGVFFSYKCEPACDYVWFEYESNDNTYVRQPVEHPLLKNLTWPRLIQTSSVIFQRKISVLTLEDLSNTPQRILTEKHLVQKYQLPTTEVKYFEDVSSLDNIDIIFTTWLPQPPQQNGTFYYTVVNTSEVKKTANNQLVLQINTDQPAKLLKLEVTYPEEETSN